MLSKYTLATFLFLIYFTKKILLNSLPTIFFIIFFKFFVSYSFFFAGCFTFFFFIFFLFFFFSFLTSTNETVCGFNGFDDFDVLTGWNFYYYIFPFLCSVLCWHMNEYNFPSLIFIVFFYVEKRVMNIFERESWIEREFKENWHNIEWKWKVQLINERIFFNWNVKFAKFPPSKST